MQRIALVLLFLVVTGVAAIFAAGHLGINLPWSIAVTEHETPPSQEREKAAAPESTSPEAAIDETAKALGGAESEPPSGSVAIDISRISPDGTSVFAGRAAPDSYVTVLENGKPAGTAKTDENGEWTLSTEHKFASTDPSVTYEVSRTPPPEPEKPQRKVAKADPAPKSAASVAGEVMRKFENLVEQAREEAKQNTNETKDATAAPEETSPPDQTTADVEPEKPESAPVTSAEGPASTEGNAAEAPARPQPNDTAQATVTAAAPDPPPSAGVKTDIIPVPIMFVYNEAKLTPEGERAAALLLEYLTLKNLNSVELSGHADERGSDDYNYDLSRERLETVSALLKQGGYTGELKLTAKGKTEPYMGVDRSAYSGEALYQLDRRVELRVTR